MASDFLEALAAIGGGVARGIRTKKTNEERDALKAQLAEAANEIRRQETVRKQREDFWQEEVARQRAGTYETGTLRRLDEGLQRLEQQMTIAQMRDATNQRGQDIRLDLGQLFEGGRNTRQDEALAAAMERLQLMEQGKGLRQQVAETGKTERMNRYGGEAGKLSPSMVYLRGRLNKQPDYVNTDPTVAAFFTEVLNDPSLEEEVMDVAAQFDAEQMEDQLAKNPKAKPKSLGIEDNALMARAIRFVKLRRQQAAREANRPAIQGATGQMGLTPFLNYGNR